MKNFFVKVDYDVACELTLANLKDSYELCGELADEDAKDMQFHLRKVIEYYSAPNEYEEWYKEVHGD